MARTRKLLTILSVWTIWSVTLFSLSCGDNKSTGGFDADSVWRGSWNRSNEDVTPKGVRVYSATSINKALFPHIDVGVDRLAVTARLENYQPMAHSELIVALFPRSRHCIAPGFLIADPSNTWDNLPPPNDFDKDPRPGYTMLCAAGLHPGENVLVVADDASHMSNIVQYEGEHATLLARDPARWVATSGVHAHPIFKQPPSLAQVEVRAEKVGNVNIILVK